MACGIGITRSATSYTRCVIEILPYDLLGGHFDIVFIDEVGQIVVPSSSCTRRGAGISRISDAVAKSLKSGRWTSHLHVRRHEAGRFQLLLNWSGFVEQQFLVNAGAVRLLRRRMNFQEVRRLREAEAIVVVIRYAVSSFRSRPAEVHRQLIRKGCATFRPASSWRETFLAGCAFVKFLGSWR